MASLKGSVGRGGENRVADVRRVQQLLNAYPIPRVSVALKEDGKAGRKTNQRIELFQRTILNMINPDGRIDPGGRTITQLNSLQGSKAASELSMSKKGKELLKSIETLATKPYDDQNGEQISSWVQGATIGYGHLISRRQWDTYRNGITRTQATELFEEDLAPFEEKVRTTITAPLKQQEFDALVILCFNIGRVAFGSSSVVKLINNPSADTPYPDLEKAWKAWNKSQGKVMRGLTNRRAAEWNMYTQGIYQKW